MLDKELSRIREHWALRHKYLIVKLRKKENIKHVMEGRIGVYKDGMETGLSFPLTPSSLRYSYNITMF